MGSKKENIYIFVIVSLSLTLLFFIFKYLNIIEQNKSEISNLKERSTELLEIIQKLELSIASSSAENRDLNDFLTILRARNTDYLNEISEKESKILNYQKLTLTDGELLQKYSKNFFLNENYTPSNLSAIPSEFLFNKNAYIEFHSRALPYLENMIKKAKSDGVNLYVLSGYRSFETQKNVKARHLTVFGTSANQFSADQGYSEHQLGTTVDLTTDSTGSTLTGFEKTLAYKWMQNNAHTFGFILSYPPDNNYYIFEPWHWRFVGVSLAEYLHGQKLNFYEIDQRLIDEYLIKIFD